MPEVTGNNNGSSRPGIVIIAIVALLLIAGIAIWFTTRNPRPDRDMSSTTISDSTTVHDVETRDYQTTPGSATQGDQGSDTGTKETVPDSAGYTP
jgi:hypothetical protein